MFSHSTVILIFAGQLEWCIFCFLLLVQPYSVQLVFVWFLGVEYLERGWRVVGGVRVGL